MSFLISATPPFVVCLVFPTGAPSLQNSPYSSSSTPPTPPYSSSCPPHLCSPSSSAFPPCPFCTTPRIFSCDFSFASYCCALHYTPASALPLSLLRTARQDHPSFPYLSDARGERCCSKRRGAGEHGTMSKVGHDCPPVMRRRRRALL